MDVFLDDSKRRHLDVVMAHTALMSNYDKQPHMD